MYRINVSTIRIVSSIRYTRLMDTIYLDPVPVKTESVTTSNMTLFSLVLLVSGRNLSPNVKPHREAGVNFHSFTPVCGAVENNPEFDTRTNQHSYNIKKYREAQIIVTCHSCTFWIRVIASSGLLLKHTQSTVSDFFRHARLH